MSHSAHAPAGRRLIIRSFSVCWAEWQRFHSCTPHVLTAETRRSIHTSTYVVAFHQFCHRRVYEAGWQHMPHHMAWKPNSAKFGKFGHMQKIIVRAKPVLLPWHMLIPYAWVQQP